MLVGFLKECRVFAAVVETLKDVVVFVIRSVVMMVCITVISGNDCHKSLIINDRIEIFDLNFETITPYMRLSPI